MSVKIITDVKKHTKFLKSTNELSAIYPTKLALSYIKVLIGC